MGSFLNWACSGPVMLITLGSPGVVGPSLVIDLIPEGQCVSLSPGLRFSLQGTPFLKAPPALAVDESNYSIAQWLLLQGPGVKTSLSFRLVFPVAQPEHLRPCVHHKIMSI